MLGQARGPPAWRSCRATGAGTDPAPRAQLPGQPVRDEGARRRVPALGLRGGLAQGGVRAARHADPRPADRPDAAAPLDLLRPRAGGPRGVRASLLPRALEADGRGLRRGGRAAPRGRHLRLHRGAAVLDPRRVAALPLLGRGRRRHDQPAGGQARARGGDLLRDARDGDRLRLLAPRARRGHGRQRDAGARRRTWPPRAPCCARSCGGSRSRARASASTRCATRCSRRPSWCRRP